ncbi:hypothetical protein [Natranaerobius thermophilus]|uniref:hypothetical protein n=1 Tax=Natranaerobius thermophilus TaxID=375929 RepID=UPI0002FEC470|nr:hypothetical protein [Natranaerobius thermophilus]
MKILEQVDLTSHIKKNESSKLDKKKMDIKRLQRENEKNYKELTVLKGEVANSITGESRFDPKLLNELIQNKGK